MTQKRRRKVIASYDIDMLDDLVRQGEVSFDSIGRVRGLPDWAYRMYRRNKR
jgi:hypothetical protein